jgi:hypothetical protein
MTKLEKILRNPPKKRIPERLSAYEIEYPKWIEQIKAMIPEELGLGIIVSGFRTGGEADAYLEGFNRAVRQIHKNMDEVVK